MWTNTSHSSFWSLLRSHLAELSRLIEYHLVTCKEYMELDPLLNHRRVRPKLIHTRVIGCLTSSLNARLFLTWRLAFFPAPAARGEKSSCSTMTLKICVGEMTGTGVNQRVNGQHQFVTYFLASALPCMVTTLRYGVQVASSRSQFRMVLHGASNQRILRTKHSHGGLQRSQE